MKRFILQAVSEVNHATLISEALSMDDVERVMIGTGFVNCAGVSAIESVLAPVAGKTRIIFGIRNGITTAQGINKIIEIGCQAIAVDTGMRGRIFHPKVYMVRSATAGQVITGSANLTAGGLSGNIEGSVLHTLDFSVDEDLAFVDEVENSFLNLLYKFPEHVYAVQNADHVQALFDSGLVKDETLTQLKSTSGAASGDDLSAVAPMALQPHSFTAAGVQPMQNSAGQTAAPVSAHDSLGLVWTSGPLTRRDLNIPTAVNTNSTGSMFFSQGMTPGIDQRHYFRDVVFAALQWAPDLQPAPQHLHRTKARFQLIIGGVNYGDFLLRVTHNTNVESIAYQQNNSMTYLHWGEAKDFVARENLLDRTMRLFRHAADPGLFVIEID